MCTRKRQKQQFFFGMDGFDHINRNAPVLIRTPKLTRFEPAQYWGGGPPGNSVVLNPFFCRHQKDLSKKTFFSWEFDTKLACVPKQNRRYGSNRPIRAKIWNKGGPCTKLWSTNFVVCLIFETTEVSCFRYHFRQILSTESRVSTPSLGLLCFPPTKIDKCLSWCFLGWGKLRHKLWGMSDVWNEWAWLELTRPEQHGCDLRQPAWGVWASHRPKSINISNYPF